MRYRNKRHAAELLPPGEVCELEIELPPTSNLFAVGHSVRLDVSSSNAPRFDVNDNSGGELGRSTEALVARNTVFHEAGRPSQLVLTIAAG
jgi:predicted acyl esterase